MGNRMLFFLLAVLLAASAIGPAFAVGYYVSPSGSDANSGSISSPFLTIQHAVNVMASSSVKTAFVRNGEYFQRGISISVGSSDSGEQLLAYPGEHPVISGGFPVTTWRQESSIAGAWSAALLSGFSTSSPTGMPPVVTVNGQWYDCARTPNVDPTNRYHSPSHFFFVNTPANPIWPPDYGTDNSFTYRGTDTNSSIYNGEPTAGIGVWDKLGWMFDPIPISSINFSTSTVNLIGGSQFGISNNSRYFIYGTKGSLDAVGEYWEDTVGGRLWIIPPSGENPNTDTVVISESEGPAVIEINGANNVLIQGLQIRDRDNSARWENAIANYAPQYGGVRIDQGDSDRIENNTFSCLGVGIDLEGPNGSNGNGATNCNLIDNEIFDTCVEGIDLGGSNTHSGNAAFGNDIHDTGLIEEGARAIRSNPAPNWIAYNSIENVPSMAIICGDETNASNGLSIEDNTIFHSSQGTDDTGAIYLVNGGNYNPSAPEVVAYNNIADTGGASFNSSGVLTYPNFSFGVYMDTPGNVTGQSGTQVHGNLFNQTGNGGAFPHEGENNNIYNNIIANAADYQFYMQSSNSPSSNLFHNNIVYYGANHDPLAIKGPGEQAALSDNIYWNWNYSIYNSSSSNFADFYTPDGSYAPTDTFATWLTSGSGTGGAQDTGSEQANPLFMDAANNGFTLLSTSPALASPYSFQQLPFKLMGTKGYVTSPIQIACGNPASVGTFSADKDFTSGSESYNYGDTVNTTQPNSAPNNVYDLERYGPNFTYTLPGFVAGSAHTVRLHFCELYYGIAGRGGTGTGAGSRYFNVAINGTRVLSNYDIVATTGGPLIADVQQFTALANSSGQIVIQFTSGTGSPDPNACVSGIEIDPPILVPIVQIACGRTTAEGTWSADKDYSGGSLGYNFGDTFDVSAPNSAPNTVYQNQHWGSAPFSYTIPNLTPGVSYVVRLHFDEDYYGIAGTGRGGTGTGPGSRYFNVSINGVSVLANFDIYADSGGPEIADVQQLRAVADSSGDITITFAPPSGSSQNPCVSGIEVLQ